MIAVFHVHTAFSDDSDYPMEQVVRDACSLGVDELCFTEHVDYGARAGRETLTEDDYEDGILYVAPDYPSYFAEIDRMREAYGERLAIRAGLELGVETNTEAPFCRLLDRWAERMDFAILSIHQVGDLEFWNGDFQRGRTQKEYNDAYYQEMLDVVRTFEGPWCVLGHIDMIKRYDPAGIYPFEPVRDLIAEILRETIASGHGIEMNTSSYRYGLPDTTPCTEIVELYRDLGGSIVTIGSDSHEPSHLASHIRDAKQRLAALGFDRYCTYEGWEPRFHSIDA